MSELFLEPLKYRESAIPVKSQINCRLWSQESDLGSKPSTVTLAGQPWEGYLTPLGVGFLLSKMGITSGTVRLFSL